MKSFLIVDDDPLTTELVKLMLEDMGAEDVAVAEDGRAALDCLTAHVDRFDAVLCDLNMPGMDGVELIRAMASLPERRWSLVLMSGSDRGLLRTVAGLAQARRLTVAGVLSKPVRRVDLATLLGTPADAPAAAAPPSPLPPLAPLAPAEVDDAIADGRLVAWFQPKVRTRDRAIAGFEALARITTPEGRVLPPACFIPSITDTALARRFTLSLADEVARWMNLWARAGLDLKVSLNVWPSTLDDLALCDALTEVFKSQGVHPGRVIFEITETDVACNAADMMDNLARLRLRGFGISIDDFGTGHSTLEKLRDFPFSELKIDQGFVRGAGSDPVARSIVQSNAALGAAVGMDTVAEGVETEEEFALVRAHAVDMVQGYLISRPMPPQDVLGFATRWSQEHDPVEA